MDIVTWVLMGDGSVVPYDDFEENLYQSYDYALLDLPSSLDSEEAVLKYLRNLDLKLILECSSNSINQLS